MKLLCPLCEVEYSVNPSIFPEGSEFQCTNCPNVVPVAKSRMREILVDEFSMEEFHLEDAGLSADDKMEILESTIWGRVFEYPMLQSLIGYLQGYHAEKNQIIFSEGDNENYMCLLGKGEVDVIKEDEAHKQRQLIRLKAGHVFGEMALIDKRPRSATAKATKVSILLVLSEERFNQLVEKEPEVAMAIYQQISFTLSKRLRRTSGMLIDFLLGSDAENGP